MPAWLTKRVGLVVNDVKEHLVIREFSLTGFTVDSFGESVGLSSNHCLLPVASSGDRWARAYAL
jgi:hypothetical protein